MISILSLYAEGDMLAVYDAVFLGTDFNPLPLCRGRHTDCNSNWLHNKFQSSPSMQRETEDIVKPKDTLDNFNPLPLCRGRPLHRKPRCPRYNFNPLPLCRGRHLAIELDGKSHEFQSSPSMQRETIRFAKYVLECYNFNPLPLCRGRPDTLCKICAWMLQFQSSPSMQRETFPLSPRSKEDGIFQSSPSMQRETFIKKHIFYILKYFNPLPLCRGRHTKRPRNNWPIYISILSLYAEGDHTMQQPKPCNHLFQSSPSMQRETVVICLRQKNLLFQSSPSMQRETAVQQTHQQQI